MTRAWVAVPLLALLIGCGGNNNPTAPGPTTPEPEPPAPDVTPQPDPEPDVPEGCEPGARRCVDKVIVEVCDAEGQNWTPEDCPSDERCDEEAQDCMAVICAAGDILGCADDRNFEVCNDTGTRTFAAPCPGGSACTNNACEQALCEEGVARCTGLDTLEVCNNLGEFIAEPCGTGKECDEGECKDLCTINEKKSSYIGCEYWSLDLDNFDDAIGQPHAIVVSNPNPTLTAEITITFPDGSAVEHEGPLEIEPLGQGVYQMPLGRDVSIIGISDSAFVVTSNIPVVAYQFNPLNNVDVFSNDGTLLLPTNTLGTEYLTMSWEQRPSPPLRGFLTVANTSGQTNTVTVTVASPTAPGPDTTSMTTGETRDFRLGPGQVLNLETLNAGDDLTGSLIISELPIAAFGGHECANVLVGIDRCDHIESQLFPINTWGTTYLGTKFFPRGAEDDVWRVMASQDGTVITLDPPPLDQFGMIIDTVILDRGEFFQFETAGHFLLTGTAPVSLAHYMVGSNWFGIPRICDTGIDAGNPTGIGDPALSIAVPIAQFREDYIVLTPLDYDEDYLSIIVETGTAIVLDGEPVAEDAFEPIGETGYAVARLLVEDGPHVVTGDRPFGLESYGYDCHVSYAYPGGLNLETQQDR